MRLFIEEFEPRPSMEEPTSSFEQAEIEASRKLEQLRRTINELDHPAKARIVQLAAEEARTEREKGTFENSNQAIFARFSSAYARWKAEEKRS